MDAAQIATLIFTGITALGGSTALVMFFRLGPDRRKVRADAAEVLSRSAVLLLEPFEKKVSTLEAKVTALTEEVGSLTEELRVERALRRTSEADRDRLRAIAAQHGLSV